MPGPISQRCREHARRVAKDFEKPLPVTAKEREVFAQQSREALEQAPAAVHIPASERSTVRT